jgi:hypothetical protein
LTFTRMPYWQPGQGAVRAICIVFFLSRRMKS